MACELIRGVYEVIVHEGHPWFASGPDVDRLPVALDSDGEPDEYTPVTWTCVEDEPDTPNFYAYRMYRAQGAFVPQYERERDIGGDEYETLDERFLAVLEQAESRARRQEEL